MAAYGTDGRCLMRRLQEELDDPAPADCGRCSVCAGPRFATPPSPELVRAAQAHLRSRPLEFEQKRMAPDAEGAMRKIPEEVRVEPGRALARMGDAGWSAEVESGLAAGRVSDEVVAAAADVVRSWGVRVEWVAAVPGADDLAARLAEALSLPFHSVLARVEERPPQSEMRNAAQQVANVRGAFAVAGEVRRGPCLLVDDRRQSGWTLAMTGGQLRQRGAGAVHPFVLLTTT